MVRAEDTFGALAFKLVQKSVSDARLHPRTYVFIWKLLRVTATVVLDGDAVESVEWCSVKVLLMATYWRYLHILITEN